LSVGLYGITGHGVCVCICVCVCVCVSYVATLTVSAVKTELTDGSNVRKAMRRAV